MTEEVAVPAVETDAQLPQQQTESTATTQQAETTPPQPDTTKDENAKVLKSVQKRIDELTRARHDQERAASAEIQKWQREAYEAHQRLQQIQVRSDEPTLENSGNDFQRYLDRRAEWIASQKINQAMQAQGYQQAQALEQQRIQSAQQAALMQHQQFVVSKVQEAKKVYPDFEQAISDPQLPPLRSANPAAYEAILSSEKGIDVAYYLAKNPFEAHRIAMLQPMQAIREVALIEAKFLGGKRVSDAPAPVSTVGSARSSEKSESDESMADYVKRRNKEIAARHKAR